jgi:hypothetical protein
MDDAFAVLPLHDWDSERRTELANILLKIARTGITDPYVLRSLALDRLPLPPQSMSLSVRNAEGPSFQQAILEA